MSVEARVSRHKINTDLMIVAACLAATAWFLYDGWFNEEFAAKHSGLDLKINQYYAPIALVAAAVYFGVGVLRDRKRRLVAEERGLVLENGKLISYDAMRRIDKRFFEKEGHFTIEYEAEGGERKLKLRDRRYDGLGLVLDEVVRRTGAAPQ